MWDPVLGFGMKLNKMQKEPALVEHLVVKAGTKEYKIHDNSKYDVWRKPRTYRQEGAVHGSLSDKEIFTLRSDI